MNSASVAHLLVIGSLLYLTVPSLNAQSGTARSGSLQEEESEDYFTKWLNEDVRYIVTSEERSVFDKLTTAEEKEQFIELFWFRRDPDPRTPFNEFKEEHYRRIAYANEQFVSGFPGWRTDRGRIYIIHGPPDQITSHASGGLYERPSHEGGGVTSALPFEIWRYRHIDGIGQDIELEFVDRAGTGEYRLARDPWEKDALMHVPGAGLTLAEEMGLAERTDRPYFNPGRRDNYPMMFLRAKDNPFQRYETYTSLLRSPEIKYKDLKELVTVDITYQNLPFQIREDYVRLSDQQVLVPITIEVENKDLAFKEDVGSHRAKVAVYGIITSITNRVITEFDDDVTVAFASSGLSQALTGRSIYQKIVLLDTGMRYRLDMVVKDLNSARTGVTRQAIIPPSYDDRALSTSSVILSDHIQPLEAIPLQDEMFVLGDVKVRPNLAGRFSSVRPLGVYLQLYHARIDQVTLSPSLSVTYRVLRDGRPVVEITDESGESIQFFSEQRVVLIKTIPIRSLEPGFYQIEVELHDRVGDRRHTTPKTAFSVTGPAQVMGTGQP